jgi:hypothetical protein
LPANIGLNDLNDLCDPHRFAQVAARHRKAFAWQPQGWIPLGIHVVNPEHARGLDLDYGAWLNPEPFLAYQTRILADTLAVSSDLLPAVAINHLGDAVLTSMFGAQQFMPDSASTTLQDVGPTPLPILSSIREVAGLQMPGLGAGIMPAVERMARFYREHLPPWVHVVAPMPAAPFSTAMELRGSDLLIDLVDQPDLCHRLIAICAHLLVQAEHRVRQLVGTPLSEHVTNFGILGVGLRLGEDSMVNLSPTMIERFCRPAFALVNRLCGGKGHIHFCSLPASRFEHVYSVLARAPEVAVVSSQFGFEYYAQHLDELRNRLAVESFYGDAFCYIRQKYGSFCAWADDFVPRFKDESGLVLYFQVESVEEGQEIWDAWQSAHRRR